MYSRQPIGAARIVSLVLTAGLLVLLGVGGARLAHTTLWLTVLETLVIAGVAAGAGIPIGKLIGG